jgi:hypothetical protein
MVDIKLDAIHKKRLEQLAKSEGRGAEDVARRILVDYLDLLSLPVESDDLWADASVALTPEVLDDPNWNEDDEHGP